MREKRARFLQEKSQHREDMKDRCNEKELEERLKGEMERLARDRAAFESERQRHLDQVMVDRMRFEAEQKRHAEEAQQRRLVQLELQKDREQHADHTAVVQSELDKAQSELDKAQEQLAEERKQLEQQREGIAKEREGFAEECEELSGERKQLAVQRKEVGEATEKMKQEQNPENLLRSLVEGFAASRPDHKFPGNEETLVEDAKRSKDSSVFRDQFKVLEAALAQKPEGEKHESGFLSGAAEGAVGALLSIQGLQEAGEKKLASELQEQLAFKASKAMNLSSAGSGKARSHEERSALRRETPLSFAFALVSVCCLLWSSARRRMQGSIASIVKDVQTVRQMLPSLECDMSTLQESLRVFFDTYGPPATSEQAREQYFKDKTAIVDRVEELKRRFKPFAKSDCIGKIVEVSSKCYQAWETFEKHLTWQRRFAQLRRHSSGPGDCRALLLASLADHEDEGASLPRELAALVWQAARQRRSGLAAGGQSLPTGDGRATATPTRPLKRARNGVSPGPAATPNSSRASAGGRAEALEERLSTPISPR